jgi:hypothetical protein
MKKKIPEFKSEAKEFEFWSEADSTEYFDWSQAKKVKFVNLTPTPRTNSDLRQAKGIREQGLTVQAAEKSNLESLVTGNDFSRAAKINKTNGLYRLRKNPGLR